MLKILRGPFLRKGTPQYFGLFFNEMKQKNKVLF
jgi:hypothetical protein